MLYSINLPNFTVSLRLLLEILCTMWCIVIICFTVCDVINFEFNVFLHDQKSHEKKLNILRTKVASNIKCTSHQF